MTPAAVRLGELRFLYIGVDDTSAAVDQWAATGATLRWRFQHFGADVAGLDVGAGPLVLLADHRPTGSVLPIWSVDDLAAARAALAAAGGRVEGPLGTPEGDAAVATSADGTELAVLEVVRPGAMDGAYADTSNTHRVR
ncbi:MAG: hypothetical protein ACXWBN_05880 [Acidimicrobiales bacterium]